MHYRRQVVCVNYPAMERYPRRRNSPRWDSPEVACKQTIIERGAAVWGHAVSQSLPAHP